MPEWSSSARQKRLGREWAELRVGNETFWLPAEIVDQILEWRHNSIPPYAGFGWEAMYNTCEPAVLHDWNMDLDPPACNRCGLEAVPMAFAGARGYEA